MLQKFSGKLSDIFQKNEKYVFLVGAGISMDPPSSLPSAYTITKSLIELCAPAEEREKLTDLNLLRYETIVEKVQKFFDNDLEFLDFFDLSIDPNDIHLFLARAIIEGHFVITTNFDYFIERSLQRLLPESSYENIIPVITKEDFKIYNNPNKLFAKGKYSIYKIHGSKKNIITHQETKESLITTISALGKDRDPGETFAIESFKKTAVFNLMKDRTLVVLGYSGSDDFDIEPILKESGQFKKLIWIDHVKNSEPIIFESTPIAKEELTEIDNLMNEIAKIRRIPVIKLEVNTSEFISKILKKLLFFEKIPNINFNSKEYKPHSSFNDWISTLNTYMVILDCKKYAFAGEIFLDLSQLQNAERCFIKAMRFIKEVDDKYNKTYFLSNLGLIYETRGDFNKALKNYRQAFNFASKNGDLRGKTICLNNIGEVYRETGEYKKAIRNFKEALRIIEQIDEYENRSLLSNAIESIHDNQRDHNKVSLKKIEQLGDIKGKAKLLNNNIEKNLIMNSYNSALPHFRETLTIIDHINDLKIEAILLNNIGMIHKIYEEYNEALQHYNRALEIDEKIGDLKGKSITLNNIGMVYKKFGLNKRSLEIFDEALKYYDKALEFFNESLKIDEELGDLNAVSIDLNNIGTLLQNRGEFNIAIKYFKAALKISKQIDDIQSQATHLNNIGVNHKLMGNFDKALYYYEQALTINEKLGDLDGIAFQLNNIAILYFQGKHNVAKAINYMERSLELFIQLGMPSYIKKVKSELEYLKTQ